MPTDACTPAVERVLHDRPKLELGLLQSTEVPPIATAVATAAVSTRYRRFRLAGRKVLSGARALVTARRAPASLGACTMANPRLAKARSMVVNGSRGVRSAA